MKIKENGLPLFSVLIPTYNRSALLQNALRSVLEQDFNDFEIIVCDDCSTDDTMSVMQKMSEQDKRIIYHRNISNLGAVENTKKLLYEHANGRYILFLCDDDYLIDRNFFSASAAIIKENTDIGVVIANSKVIDEQAAKEQISNLEGYGIFNGRDYFKTHKRLIPNINAAFLEIELVKNVYRDISPTNWEAGLEILFKAYWYSKVAHMDITGSAWVYHSAGTGFAVANRSAVFLLRAVDCYWNIYRIICEDGSFTADEMEHVKIYFLRNPLYDFLCALYKEGIKDAASVAKLFSERDPLLGAYLQEKIDAVSGFGYATQKEFAIYGAGIAGKQTSAYLKKAGVKTALYIDDSITGEVDGIPVRNSSSVRMQDYNIVIGIGSSAVSEKIFRELKAVGADNLYDFNDYIFALFINGGGN